VLPKSNRLKEEKDFKRVYNKGRYTNGSYISIKYLYLNYNSATKIGVVVSKKINNKATVRNKIKRQINDVFGYILDKIQKNVYIIVTVKKIPEDYASIKEDIKIALEKGRLL
jgi:ribonuclease P protein component